MVKVLIAEDDLLVADMAEEVLVTFGFEVCGIARTVPEAIALGRLHKPDVAVIDVLLADGGVGTEIAAQLRIDGKLGVLYASGNISMLTGEGGEACLAKPYRPVDLLRGVVIVTSMAATGTTSAPFPPGFQILKPDAPAS